MRQHTITKGVKMFKEFASNEKEDDYLSEFRQKVATQQQEDIAERQSELQRSRNGFIGTLAGIILAGVVSWVLFLPRFTDNNPAEIPVIRRPITPVKIQPNEPGGMEILNQDKSVYNLVEKKEIAPEKIESILPEPEAPKMPTIVPEPEKPVAAKVKEPEPAAAEEPKTTAAKTDILPIKPLDEHIEPTSSTSGKKIAIPEKLPEIKVEVKKAEPQTVVKTEPAKSEVKAEPKSEVKKAEPQTVVKTEPAKSEVKAEPKSEVKTAPRPEPQKNIATGVWQVQLMASSSQKAAEDSWKNSVAKYSALKNLPHEVDASRNDAGVMLYRLRAGAFADKAGAEKVCNEIKQAGGSCLVKQK